MTEVVGALVWSGISFVAYSQAREEYTKYKAIEPNSEYEVEAKEKIGLEALDSTYLAIAAAAQIPPYNIFASKPSLRAAVFGCRMVMLGGFFIIGFKRFLRARGSEVQQKNFYE